MTLFSLPDLPYNYNALAPYMSENTLHFHHDKHHKAYVDMANILLNSDDSVKKIVDSYAGEIEEIIPASKLVHPKFFNNLAQHWNHTKFWESMAPSDSNTPPKDLLSKHFGSYQSFEDQFIQKGVGQFGSGWVWLIYTDNNLEIISTSNAENPLLIEGAVTLLVCDVWEHTYYLDYQNRRADYLKAFLHHMVNWNKVIDFFNT